MVPRIILLEKLFNDLHNVHKELLLLVLAREFAKLQQSIDHFKGVFIPIKSLFKYFSSRLV